MTYCKLIVAMWSAITLNPKPWPSDLQPFNQATSLEGWRESDSHSNWIVTLNCGLPLLHATAFYCLVFVVEIFIEVHGVSNYYNLLQLVFSVCCLVRLSHYSACLSSFILWRTERGDSSGNWRFFSWRIILCTPSRFDPAACSHQSKDLFRDQLFGSVVILNQNDWLEFSF